MKIYLDNCCYNRPFDDQTQQRIHLESEAILEILYGGFQGKHQIIGSEILDIEIEGMQSIAKKQKVKNLYEVIDAHISYTKEIRERAIEITNQSKIKMFDGLHIAAAEAGAVDVMLTTDDKLEKMAEKLELKVKVMNPLRFILEET